MITTNEVTPHEGNGTVTPLNKYTLNKNNLGNKKVTEDGWVFDEEVGEWTEGTK